MELMIYFYVDNFNNKKYLFFLSKIMITNKMNNFKLFFLFFITIILQNYLFAQSGVIDINFNNGNIALAEVGASDLDGDTWGIGIQSDGKILSFIDDSGTKMIRFNKDGTIDSDFGTVTSSIRGRALAIQEDDKILVGTIVGDIERYNADGSIDDTFDSSGWPMFVYGLGIQPDGKVVAAGRFQNANFDYGIARYNSDGTLDVPFGTNGTTLIDPTANSDWGKSVTVLSDGKLLLQGATFITDSDITYLMKLDASGNLDTSFGIDGLVKIDNIGISNFTTRSHELPNGKILVVGQANYGSSNQVFILRLNTDGTRDDSFGTNGLVFHPSIVSSVNREFLQSENTNNSILLPDGKILVNGIFKGPSAMVINDAFAVRRYNADGSVDNSFGIDGMIYAELEGTDISAPWMSIDPDWSIVQVGKIINGNTADIVAVRYLFDNIIGTLDFESNENSISVFPNPIDEKFNLQFTLANEKELDIFLSDVNGRILHQYMSSEKFNSGEHQLDLDLSTQLTSGVYYLTIMNNEKPITVQVFKK